VGEVPTVRSSDSDVDLPIVSADLFTNFKSKKQSLRHFKMAYTQKRHISGSCTAYCRSETKMFVFLVAIRFGCGVGSVGDPDPQNPRVLGFPYPNPLVGMDPNPVFFS
jgi:hypothetical protein